MEKNYINDIEIYLEKLKSTINALDKNEINVFINQLVKARNDDRQIFIMGNGGSASTASHFCCDFNKGASYGFDSKRFKFICLNDNVAGMMAYANDISYDSIFVEQLKNFFNEGDLVIGISGSGNSENVLKAIEYANANSGITIGLTGFNGGKLREISTYSVNMNVDDMQITEDLHVMLDHLSMKIVANEMISKV